MHNRTDPVVSLVAVFSAATLIGLVGRAARASDDLDEQQLDLETLALESDDGSLRVEPVVLVQPMFQLRLDRSADVSYEGSGFLLRKGEAGFKAHVGDQVYFKLVGAFEHGEAEPVDAYVHVYLLDQWLALRVGYFKPPYCRQFLTPDAYRQLADNAVSTVLVEPREQLGARLGGLLLGMLEYELGVWIAADRGFAATTGAATDPLAGGRLVLHPLGHLPAEGEPDLGFSESPLLAIGGSALYDRRDERVVPLVGIGDVGYSDNRLRVGGELAAKWRGASAAAEFFFSRVWVADDTPAVVADRLPPVRAIGGYLQLGYFVLRERLDIAARFDFVDPDLEIAGWTVHPAAGAQLYLIGHALKLLAMYRLSAAIYDPYPEGSPLHTPAIHDFFFVLQGAI
jgi:hypothetical protein